MKLSSLQENLKAGLIAVSHIAGKNINLPILGNVMIEAKDGKIRFITTDLEIGIVVSVRGKIETEGVYTVDSRVLTDYVSLLPNQKVDIELKDNKLMVRCDSYKTTMHGTAADEFPLIPQVERQHEFSVDQDEFKRALAQVLFAVSNSESRMELTGVHFELSGNTLTMAATDSYRLAERTVALKKSAPEVRKLIVPAKTLQELARVLGGVKADLEGDGKLLTGYLGDNQILFTVGNIELISRLIEGHYPDYRQIIPSAAQTTVTLERSEIVRGVKAAALFSKSGINDINLDFPLGKKQVTVTAASSQVGEQTAEITAEVTGKDNGIVVNYRYLLDGLNAMDADTVVLEVVNGATPCLLKGVGDQNYRYVIMPIKQ